MEKKMYSAPMIRMKAMAGNDVLLAASGDEDDLTIRTGDDTPYTGDNDIIEADAKQGVFSVWD